MAKLILSDNSPENRRRTVAASGGYQANDTSTGKKVNNRYAHSTTANLPITKNAQYAGAGANVAMTQPMFFSPLHTPQNWQIASRRREIMQWARFYYMNEPKVAAGVDFYCFEPNSQVLMENGTQKAISSIVEGDYVRSHDGSPNMVEKVHKREANEDMLRIKVSGVSMGTMKVTKGHDILTERDGKVKFVPASSLKEGEYLLTPCNYDSLSNHIVDNDFAWLVGVYASEGCGIPYTHTSKNSKYSQYFNGVIFTISMEEKDTLAEEIKTKVKNIYPGKKVTIREVPEAGRIEVKVFGQDIADDLVGHCPGTAKFGDKKFINVVLKWSNENLIHLLSGYFAGDGCFNIKNGFQGVGVARKMMDQLANICDRIGIEYSYTQTRLGKHNRQTIYNIRISRRACDIFKGLNYKFKENIVDNSKIRNTPYFVKGNYIYRKILNIKEYYYNGDVYDLTVSNKSSYVVHRVAVHNSNFSMNGFKLECKSRKILRYYERLAEKLELSEKLNAVSHEYFLLGDVFPFTEIECPHCHGSNRTPDGDLCNHPDGSFKSIKLMNPDYIDVKDNPIASNPEYYLVPDEELKMLVTRREPKSAYDALPQSLIDLVNTGQPIPLSTRSISHMKYNAADYATYGTSMLQRLFTVLAYKTKMMTANWIVAERLILPIRVVKIGDKDRPATDADLQDVQNQLSAVANDPNLTIVTHHAFDYEWYGASGKIHNITQELEEVGKEILDGLMLNQAILNGEMAGYCLSADTTTLCDSGFKHHWEIDPKKDKIACYNPDTKKIEYHLPYEKVVYDYEGEMVHFNTDKIDILVTPNHRMWSAKRDSDKYRFIKAEDVRPRARFIGAVDGYEGEYQKSIQIGEEEYSIYDYCKMVGYYVSEGWVREEKGDNRKHQFTTVGICQSKNSKDREDIENVFESMFDKHWEEENQVCVYKPELAKYLKENFGKGFINKKLSPFVKNLTPECLEIVLEAMINGDGCVHSHVGENRKVNGESYYTSSYQLAEDFAEIAFKCGYVTKIREYNKKDSKNKKYFNKTGHEYITRHQQYVVYISKGFKGRTPTLCSKSKKYAGKEITRVPYNGKIYCFSVPHELFVTMRNGIISIQGNTSAQVGIEVLIRRLDNWRNKLKLWVEKNIFRPVAMMQGFIDEEESKELGETVYLYPELTWNDLQLRDKTNRIQTLVQLHDKGLVSAQTLLEELDLDYDSEVEKIREESIMAQANGMVAGGGDPNAAGGMGGMPGGDMGGAGMPPDMAGEGMGGAPGAPGGGMGMGGAPGGDMGGMGGGAPMGAAASGGELPTIGKRGSKSKQQQEEELTPPPTPIKLTKLEGKMFKTLTSMQVPHDLFAQYQVKVPGEARPYAIDFAYPKIGVGIECLHPETYVPTTEGIKKADEIQVGDKLFGRDGKEVEVTRYIEKEYDKDMYTIKPHGMLPITITDNHPLYICKPERIRVKRKEPKITRTRGYYVPGKNIKVRADEIEIGDYVVVPKRISTDIQKVVELEQYNNLKIMLENFLMKLI